MKKKLTYKTAGVDIDKADAFVKAIKGLVKSTRQPGVMDKTKAFGSLLLFLKDIKNQCLFLRLMGWGPSFSLPIRSAGTIQLVLTLWR